MPFNSLINSSGLPTITSGDMPATSRTLTYSNLDLSSGTIHTCLPFVCLQATAKPMLVAVPPPCDHASTMKLTFHPAAIDETSSAIPESLQAPHCKAKTINQASMK
ncbi:hypothetical protein J1N35_008983 [Gossypium stocksii]|uniref:Uncharacterized protein n=1 Tax=Gossypium stocksii TaxID=47602 RepID=A0A9D4AH54_9ROSI|nr:hypothetical protein J1N35_008983 [Gossypium stocksii]